MAEKNNIPQFVNSDSFMADKNYVQWLSDLILRQRDSRGQIFIKYANGICSILHKLIFCTRLVQNYRRWIM